MISLSDLTLPVFEAGMQLKGRQEQDLGHLQKDLLFAIAQFSSTAQKEGYSPAMIDEAQYALCAWLDEYIYTQTNISLDWFAHSLAVKTYDDAAAGIHFFERMDALHRQADRMPVLMVYLRCMLMGFQGRYRLEEPGHIQALIDEVTAKNASLTIPSLACAKTAPGTLPRDKHGIGLLAASSISLAASLGAYVLLAIFSAFKG